MENLKTEIRVMELMRETRELEDAAIQEEQKAIDDLEKLILQRHLYAA
jgi:hypothetical protein